MDLDAAERRTMRQEARDNGLEVGAVLCEQAAMRLLGGRARVNQVDRHTADVLHGMAEKIRAEKSGS